jgi:hypothetical protein
MEEARRKIIETGQTEKYGKEAQNITTKLLDQQKQFRTEDIK